MTTSEYLKYIRGTMAEVRKSTMYSQSVHSIGAARGQIQLVYAAFLISHEDYATLCQELEIESEWARNELKGGYL